MTIKLLYLYVYTTVSDFLLPSLKSFFIYIIFLQPNTSWHKLMSKLGQLSSDSCFLPGVTALPAVMYGHLLLIDNSSFITSYLK